MRATHTLTSSLVPRRVRASAVLVVLGEALLLAAHRPISDFYFPLVWLGLTLLLDGAIELHTGSSLSSRFPRHFAALFALSIAFWWVFEGFDQIVGNWHYIGAQRYTGVRYVVFASVDFSLVLAAVWEAATVVSLLLQRTAGCEDDPSLPPRWLLLASLTAGVAALALPVANPHAFFGLIWVSLFFLLDPINAWAGRPSLWAAIWNRQWQLPVSFALGALMCGFFWESWNQWAMPKWEYSIPYVGFWHIFQMPLLGWLGYLPFGLELFAMTNFVLPLFRLTPLTLREMSGDGADDADREQRTA